eukprot:COSAG06_NODE_4946_length_3839_cov_29.189690_7_plen_59_part_01
MADSALVKADSGSLRRIGALACTASRGTAAAGAAAAVEAISLLALAVGAAATFDQWPGR